MIVLYPMLESVCSAPVFIVSRFSTSKDQFAVVVLLDVEPKIRSVYLKTIITYVLKEFSIQYEGKVTTIGNSRSTSRNMR